MEVFEHDFLEELLALRREAWETIPSPNEENQLFLPDAHNSLDCFDPNSLALLPNSFSDQQVPQSYNYYSSFNEIYNSLLDEFSTPQIIGSSPYTTLDTNSSLSTPPFLVQEEHNPLSSMMEEEGLFGEELQSLDLKTTCKMEPISPSPVEMPVFDTGTCTLERKNRPKKLLGQPSKNLMAERRRRKRLNDRLSMLRSIVPKISKMDRTSILGDTIDYMKELLDKIKNLQQETDLDSNVVGVLKDAKPNEIIVRNSPKFDVERRNADTRVDICCAGKPGLLLSTVNTLEALGLDIQQCVISCFNDFTMQASCSEELEQRTIIGSGDIKQALFRSAGYGGRCL
ncbi:transcription factor bHLH93-like [Prosopis cineraria]|uniref:transcription factor bHLH93-like n=1 Tax=Prosopis cineraria TaxID=364024 RepID=UPI00240F48F4|nr:transcription factor bHLH93-like [Prosopis cineraria]